MSATAQRWWVKLASRWLARLNAIDGLLNMVSLSVTALSTMLFAMQSYGYGQYAPYVLVAAGIAGPAFAYLYAEGGVYNQQQRDYKDLSRNYTEPKDRINKIMGAMTTFYALNKRPPTAEEEQEIIELVDRWWLEFRDGIKIGDDQIEAELLEALNTDD